MTRLWNFSAGPAALPLEVLQQAATELPNWRGAGMSVMEMSHRSVHYTEIFNTARQRFRNLLNIPDTHEVLFMQGGAIGMNAIVPLNLIGSNALPKHAAFINTGTWSAKTSAEFSKYGQAHVVYSNAEPGPNGVNLNEAQPSGESPGTYLPDLTELPQRIHAINQALQAKQQAPLAYLHYCDNETIGGVEFTGQIEAMAGQLPCPVVADMSSNILSKPIHWPSYGLVYGGAQKNIGPAGLTFVVVNKSLLNQASSICPSAFHFETVAANGSMYNTPPTYAIYIAGLVFEWLENKGGVAWAEQAAMAKSQLLYQLLDNSQAQGGLYKSLVAPNCRSRMNVPFVLTKPNLDDAFLQAAKAQGLVQLKGHKSVGGMRASLYNAMPLAGVEALVQFMRDFEQQTLGKQLTHSVSVVQNTATEYKVEQPIEAGINALRAEIDTLDASILQLLNQRASLAQRIGHLKADANAPVMRPCREAQIIDRLSKTNTGPLLNSHVSVVFKEIMSVCRALERQLHVAFLGPLGTYTEQAVWRFFGSAVVAEPAESIEEAFRQLEARHVDYAVVPIENSTEGSVARTLDALVDSNARICGEVQIPIHHEMLTQTGTLDGVTEVHAHPQALAQCRQWLQSHAPHLVQHASASNGFAAQMASQHPHIAAIAGPAARTRYALQAVQTHIQDDANNTTRFLVLGYQSTQPTGQDKTSLVASVPNQAGAVYKLLEPLNTNQVSMTRLESRPSRTKAWEYYFFIDIMGHETDPAVAQALKALQQTASFLKVLGSYPISVLHHV